MKPGDKNRIQCNECDAETEVTYEPKASPLPADKRPEGDADVTACPMCGSDQFEVLDS